MKKMEIVIEVSLFFHIGLIDASTLYSDYDKRFCDLTTWYFVRYWFYVSSLWIHCNLPFVKQCTRNASTTEKLNFFCQATCKSHFRFVYISYIFFWEFVYFSPSLYFSKFFDMLMFLLVLAAPSICIKFSK